MEAQATGLAPPEEWNLFALEMFREQLRVHSLSTYRVVPTILSQLSASFSPAPLLAPPSLACAAFDTVSTLLKFLFTHEIEGP